MTKRLRIGVRTTVALAGVGGAALLATFHSPGSRPNRAVLREGPTSVARTTRAVSSASRRVAGPIVRSVTPTLTPPLRDLVPAPPVPRVEREPEVPARPTLPSPPN